MAVGQGKSKYLFTEIDFFYFQQIFINLFLQYKFRQNERRKRNICNKEKQQRVGTRLQVHIQYKVARYTFNTTTIKGASNSNQK